MVEDLSELIGLLRAYGGDVTAIEVKSGAGGLPGSLTATMSALANLPGGGTIILGVDERAGFRPVTLADRRSPGIEAGPRDEGQGICATGAAHDRRWAGGRHAGGRRQSPRMRPIGEAVSDRVDRQIVSPRARQRLRPVRSGGANVPRAAST